MICVRHSAQPTAFIIVLCLYLAVMASSARSPVSFPTNRALICNGRDREPCAIKLVHSHGVTMTSIVKTDPEWCRLLCRAPLYTRPFAGLQLFKKWDEAVKAARLIHLPVAEELEGGRTSKRQRLRECAHSIESHPVVTIVMPKLPNSEETISFDVANELRSYSFVYKVSTIEWARKFIQQEMRDAGN